MNRCGQNVHVEYTATEEFTSLYPIQPGNFSHGGVPDQEHQDTVNALMDIYHATGGRHCAPNRKEHIVGALIPASAHEIRLDGVRERVRRHLNRSSF